MGWFEHGSTIIVFAPPGFALCPGIIEGATVRMGEPLMRLPAESAQVKRDVAEHAKERLR
jgi:hypothetical protein